MIGTRVAPTRSQLLRSRRRLERVRKGIDLLTRKRRALVADLFKVAHPAIEARARVDARAAAAYSALLAARAVHGDGPLDALGWPGRKLEVDVAVSESWGVATGAVERLAPVHRTLPGRGQNPGLTGPAATAAADEFERLVELLLDAASTELRLRRLAEALARTSRQVNTLERRVAPGLEEEATRVRALLEEREREDHARLKRLVGRRSRTG
ncbi:MAG: V-type ATP synthase subunit D [Gemmatimonadetes bacterium]|nr:V-type ATP synthase subunit D [Gemmatimonadota bacterium]MCC7132722.1 V-type ATP synthase subunit D [Gemmatimonadales bacterium]